MLFDFVVQLPNCLKLYIEARDRNDYTSTPAYTTIGIQIANAPWALKNKPYFNTTDNQPTLYFNVPETISNGTVLFDLKAILTVPNGQLPIYFRLFDAGTCVHLIC
jgi:hypothetical protein